MEYAYSVIDYDKKGIQETDDFFIVEGIASTPTPDRMRDIVEPLGAKYKTPMPLLWQHRSSEPVGNVVFADPKKDGIPFKAEIPKVKETGRLKDRIDEAIQSVKYKLVAAVSIGFDAIEYSFMDNGGIHFQEWEWLELSLVTIPANPEARLKIAKSLDNDLLAALGRSKEIDSRLRKGPGVTERKYRHPIRLINPR